MERLQSALHRAREKRNPTGQGRAPSTPGGEVTLKSRGAVSEDILSERWSSLKPYNPTPRHLQSTRVMSYFGKQKATPFDMMRTKLVQQAKANKWKRIVVTSPTPKCGKTTTTANLAFSLSRNADLRILVVELDLRRPYLANVLGITEPHYFAKALAGQEPPEDHMVCFANNLAIGTNLAAAASPSELLQSSKTSEVLAELEATYQPDLVLFDTAPVLASDDTLGFLEQVDAALIIAAAEMTTIDEIDVAESEISEVTEVMGIVLNKCRYMGGTYGYEYGYGYGYY